MTAKATANCGGGLHIEELYVFCDSSIAHWRKDSQMLNGTRITRIRGDTKGGVLKFSITTL